MGPLPEATSEAEAKMLNQIEESADFRFRSAFTSLGENATPGPFVVISGVPCGFFYFIWIHFIHPDLFWIVLSKS